MRLRRLGVNVTLFGSTCSYRLRGGHVRRIGAMLMLAGAGLWLIGLCAWLSGVWISLSPAAAKVYMLALLTLSGGTLLIAGALVSRALKRQAHRDVPVRAGLR